MRISDWSSDVCSSDLLKCSADSRRPRPLCCCARQRGRQAGRSAAQGPGQGGVQMVKTAVKTRDGGKGPGGKIGARRTAAQGGQVQSLDRALSILERLAEADGMTLTDLAPSRSEEHTSELQSLMRI